MVRFPYTRVMSVSGLFMRKIINLEMEDAAGYEKGCRTKGKISSRAADMHTRNFFYPLANRSEGRGGGV